MSLTDLTVEQYLQSVWAVLRRIEDNLSLPPAPFELPVPQVYVEPPDLEGIIGAVRNLRTGPTAAEIASALAGVLPSQGTDTSLASVAAALEKLDFRLQGMGAQAYGGGSVSLAPGQTLPLPTGAATEMTLAAVLAAVDGLELGIDNLDLSVDNINLNTDGLEAALASILAKLQATIAVTGTFFQATPATPRNGRATIAVTNTAAVLSGSLAVYGVIIQALAGNGGNVVVGDSGVTAANGYELQPGQATSIAIDNVNKMYVNGTAGDGVCWMGS